MAGAIAVDALFGRAVLAAVLFPAAFPVAVFFTAVFLAVPVRSRVVGVRVVGVRVACGSGSPVAGAPSKVAGTVCPGKNRRSAARVTARVKQQAEKVLGNQMTTGS
ncbi:hypothetical protein [Kitasatospora sp. NPDC127035]|uniref:hypothetical protein n=1 Tax=Kitasatospora sp. NPDC127035 TaxID=3347111 RepID=UPI003658CCFE